MRSSASHELRSIDVRGWLRVALAAAAVTLASETALAAFPGANGRITFDREDVEVFSILPDGTGETNLTDDPADDDAAAWSPDGARIVFSSDRGGNPDIWLMDAGGQNLVQVTSGPDNDDHPAWSPDGTRIVFQREQSGDDDVWVVDLDGSGATNLTNDPAEDDEAPAWSPDGTRIAFCSNGDVWLMNPDGTGRTVLTPGGSNECNPNWSPDGTQIAFDSDAGGDQEIVVMNADGSGQAQRTFNGENDHKPAWSPDGTKIVFEAARSGDDQIHVIDTAGGNETAVTDASNPDDDREPDWQPLSLVTTTMAVTTTTLVTTTTIPGAPAAGRKLLLKDTPGKPQKRALVLLAKDQAIGRGAENLGAGDPVVHGGFLKVVSSTGDGFNTTYDLPAASWRYKGKQGKSKGYKLTGAGPIRTVLVKLGKTLKVVARGDALGHSLGADPAPVHVALGLGAERYCFTFGGQTKFKAKRSYVAKKAPAPGACAALVPACGDRLLERGESCPTFEGPDTALAIDAVSDFDGPTLIPASAYGTDAAGVPLVRTRLEVVFETTATVAQVDAALATTGARIVSMLAGVPSVVIDVPDPGTAAALDALVGQIQGAPGIRFVLKAYEPIPTILPPNYTTIPLSPPDAPRIDHHLAVRAAAAWNARRAMSGLTTVAVMDFFGDGVPDGALDAELTPGDFTAGGQGDNGEHGYHVLGIISGSFGGAATPRGQVTGMLPGSLPTRVVDMRDPSTDSLTEDNRLIQRVRDETTTPHAVINTSLGRHCGLATEFLAIFARWWVEKVRFAGLEDRALHVTAAGNIEDECPEIDDAETGSSYAAAALFPLQDFGGNVVPNLTNTLVVENTVNAPDAPFAPLCLAVHSKFPGHVSGIGTDVFSLTNAASSAGDKTGTSMATPQVAGLAAYLWALAPAMTVDDVKRTLLQTARPVDVGPGADCAVVSPAPAIDAYEAVLALDAAALPTPDNAPIRLAILDRDGDGTFDEADLAVLTFLLLDGDNLEEPTDPGFERADLNGDGFTGGANRRTSFDLDRVGSTQYGASQRGEVTQNVEGMNVPFDEAAVNDLDVLCYYAYSALYEGSDEQRRQELGIRRCGRITMTVDFPTEVQPGSAALLTATVRRERSTGSELLSGVHVALSPAGGTAAPPDGTTNAQGEFASLITLDEGATSVEVIVQALTAPGGDVLAEEVVLAVGPCTDAPTDVEIDFGNGEPDPTVVGPTLQNNIEYRLTTSGTYTFNSTQQWANGVCKGAAAAGEGGPTGLDTEFIFAVPAGSALCGPDFECCPNHSEKFQISLDGGGVFEHVEPISPTLSASHVYEYLVRGTGVPVHLRLAENNNRGDDYGIVRVNIACASDVTTTTTSTTTSTTSSSTTTTTPSTTSTLASTSTTLVSTTSSTSTTTLFGVPVIPYARYTATGPDGPVVMLEDEFVTETVDLGAVNLQLPPVTIDGLPPFDPFTSQTCHAHPGGTLDQCIDIQDLFGVAPLRIGNPVGVCVPELFPGIGVDAFKCYAATGSAPEVEVALTDEFQSQTVTVGAPDLLCTPVAVDGSTLVNSIRYLVCYATAPPGAAGGPIEVENTLHQSPIQLDVGMATGFCVPAVRQLVATCQLCGNGVIDGGEDCDDGGVVGGDDCSAVCRFEHDCTCNGLPLPPPDEARCATLADCGGFCTACTTGGGVCGCQ